MDILEWGRRSALITVGACALWACDSTERPPLATGTVEGRVVFTGPAADVPVRLVRVSDNGTLAEGRTDADGRYRLPGLHFDAGRFRLEADLGDQPWRLGEQSGRHPADLRLTATVDLARHGSAWISVTGFTTLADALASSLPADQGDPLGRARAGLEAHLDLPPVATPVGDPLADLTPADTRHRLLVDALARLGAQLARQAGRPDAIAPGATLLALAEDARGLEPPGLFDGQGRTGPVFVDGAAVPLDPDALRHHLAASAQALVDGEPTWLGVPAAQLAPIVRRLTCSPSAVFPPCDAGAIDDETPPVLDSIEPPPGTELRGVVDVRIRAHEPDGSLARVTLQIIRGEAREPIPALPGPGYVFRVDTDAVQGVAQLEAEVVVTNAAGLETRRIVNWALPERTVGRLQGVAWLGAIQHARVRAYDLADPPLLLAAAVTDEAGAFALDIVGYNGPVQIEVGDDPGAAGGAPSQWDDPAGGLTRWPSGLRLRALVPEFRASSPPSEPLFVTPLTDLALARAERAQADGALLVGAYIQAAEAVAAAVGLPRDADALHFTRPPPGSRPWPSRTPRSSASPWAA